MIVVLIAQAVFALHRLPAVVGQPASETQTALRNGLFDFEKNFLPDGDLTMVHRGKQICKTYPTDPDWPTSQQWDDFNSTVNGTLIKTTPEASVCYSNGTVIAATHCQALTDSWNNSTQRITDPTSIHSLLFQGMTCMPPAYSATFLGNNQTCVVGVYPEFVLNATTVAQIQLTVQFARKHNVRLVIKNTGHDFGAKSVGKGAVSIWTHHLKDTEYMENYEGNGYTGKAIKLSAGVQVFEAYDLAKKHGITLVGGEGKTVGFVGGYVQGGGHSPLTSIWGMAADHVLSIRVVTADGRFLTVDADNNSDLFWAKRGGGGSTYGVVTSLIIKAFPQIKVTTMRYNMTTGGKFTQDKFWAAQRAYVDIFDYYANLGYYAYYRIRHVNGEIFHDMTSWVAPNTSEADFRISLAPLFEKWKALGVPFDPIIQEYDNFSDAWADGFPQEGWTWTMRQASRFFPRENFMSETTRADSLDAIRDVFEEGANLIMFNIRNPPGSSSIYNAVNPAWREVLMFALMFVTWSPSNSTEYVTQLSRNLTYEWNPRWKKLTPGSGTYMSESDYIEPDWQQSFHGAKYERLYALKQKWDPDGIFYAQNAVGSEDWALSEMLLGHLPSQNKSMQAKALPPSEDVLAGDHEAQRAAKAKGITEHSM